MQRSILVNIVLIFMLTGCSSDSDETKIKNQINAMAQAIEVKNGREFISYLDEKFQDQDGRKKKQIRSMLAVIFLQNNQINISYSIDRVQVQDKNAQATILVRGSDGKLLNFRASKISIQSQWKKHNGDWILYRARWKKINPDEAQ